MLGVDTDTEEQEEPVEILVQRRLEELLGPRWQDRGAQHLRGLCRHKLSTQEPWSCGSHSSFQKIAVQKLMLRKAGP